MLKSQYEFFVTINGRKITEYSHEGDTFIEGRKGSQYEIVFKNNSYLTKKIVVSVDGLNVITGNRDWKRGYVIKPYSQMAIPGFKRDQGTAAAFTFSSIKESYNQQNVSGEIQNIGVIGCLVFDEVVKINNYVPRYPYGILGNDPNWELTGGIPSGQLATFTTSATAYDSSMPRTKGIANIASNLTGCNSSAMATATMNSATASIPVATASLGTEFGSDVAFKTKTVDNEFVDAHSESFTFYYDDATGLRQRGITLKPVAPLKPNPFPGLENFCPDPVKSY